LMADCRRSTVDFGEGQDLRKGDVLARIDPVVYQARDNQAIAKTTFVLSNVEFDLVQGSRDATMVTAGLPPPVLDRRETRGDPDLDVPCLCFREPNSGERRGNRDQQQRRTLDPRSFASMRLLSHKRSFAEAVL
jgi:multidrug efflux pump subunit AcrA (membrane-fusion protein)